jgi:hypothetical protein
MGWDWVGEGDLGSARVLGWGLERDWGSALARERVEDWDLARAMEPEMEQEWGGEEDWGLGPVREWAPGRDSGC